MGRKREDVNVRKRRAAESAGSLGGALFIIGGREDKSGEMKILKEIVSRAGDSPLVVATIASEVPGDLWEDYATVFTRLGVRDVRHLHVPSVEGGRDERMLRVLDRARVVFMTGGDQLRITTKIGGTAIAERLMAIHREGGIIAGTSAGASVMGEAMLVGGENQESHKVGNWMMAPGLGFVREMIIDQHFAQRGRIGRLLGAVALNPGVLGIGIDEDTAIVIEGEQFRVIGSNAVYVVDAHGVTYTNISEASPDKTMAMHNTVLHILSEDDRFVLKGRRPRPAGTPSEDEAMKETNHTRLARADGGKRRGTGTTHSRRER